MFTSDKEFQEHQVDNEGAPSTPKASPELFEDSLPHRPESGDVSIAFDGLDAEAILAEEASMIANEDDDKRKDAVDDEMEVADLFWDGEDAEMMDPISENSMVDALLGAGANTSDAQNTARRICSVQPPTEFMEIYGRSISDYAGMHRRNLNVCSLGALDLRTLKDNGEPWDFTKRSDRKLARDLVNQKDPEWIIGAPPCTAYSIRNHGINYKKMSKGKVRAMMDEGRLHLRFMCSLYRRQIDRGIFSSTSTQPAP